MSGPGPGAREPAGPLARVASLKVKLGLLVATSVLVTAVVASTGRAAGVPPWLSVPVTVGLALGVTQLLAAGMIAPLRQMTAAARRMAAGEHDLAAPAAGVATASADEVGELARAFATMARDLAATDRDRRELVATVSHELRTPLAGLRAVLENHVDGVGGGDPEALRPALAQAERLSALVDDLLDLARADAGRAPFHPRPVRVADLLATVVAEPRAHMAATEVAVEVAVEPADLEVEADPGRLHQLVANLLDNAVRHSPADGTVRLAATVVGDRWRLEVRDDGPGVAPADRRRVLERFGTLAEPGSRGRTGGGTGLGLAVARWVVDLHGGRIAFVDPEPGPGQPRGARVRVDLPSTPPARSPGPTPATTPSSTPSSTPAPLQEDPVSRPGETIRSSPAPAPAPAPPSAQGTPSLLDDVFGRAWADHGTSARLGLLLGALGVGLLAALLLPAGGLGLATTLVLLAGGAVVARAAAGRADRFTAVCGGLGVALALVATLRAAEWVVVLCLLAGVAVTLAGTTGARSLAGLVLAALAWPLAALRGLPWLGRTLRLLPGTGRRSAALLRTAAISVVVLVVFGALLVSADAVLAGWADTVLVSWLPELRPDTAVQRVFVALAVTGLVLATAYLALNPPTVEREGAGDRTVAHRFEWLAPVAVVVTVFALFLAAQATVLFGGEEHLRRVGVTYAEYVRQGFGQLVVATALTLLVVTVTLRRAPRDTTADRTWLRIGVGVLCAEALVVVASALHRLDLYQEAYGFTRLRLLAAVAEGWLGVLLLTALATGLGLRAGRLARVGLVTGTVALLGLAAVNPDARIAERNLDRYAETGRVDWSYLEGLSDDALPVLVERAGDRSACWLPGRATIPTDDDGWTSWNLGRARAADAYDELPGVTRTDRFPRSTSGSGCVAPD